MPTMKELFSQMTNQLLEAFEQQRALHTSAFGKPNAAEIIQQADANGKKLEGWREDLQLLEKEMEESGMFHASRNPTRKRLTKSSQGRVSKGVYAGTKPAAVALFGKQTAVTTWREVLFFVLEVLHQREPERVMDFEYSTVLNKKRQNFSREKSKISKAPMYSPQCVLR